MIYLISAGDFYKTANISYTETNALLFDAIDYIKRSQKGELSEVALSIIRILETIKRGRAITWEDAEEIWKAQGLEAYLLTR